MCDYNYNYNNFNSWYFDLSPQSCFLLSLKHMSQGDLFPLYYLYHHLHQYATVLRTRSMKPIIKYNKWYTLAITVSVWQSNGTRTHDDKPTPAEYKKMKRIINTKCMRVRLCERRVRLETETKTNLWLLYGSALADCQVHIVGWWVYIYI